MKKNWYKPLIFLFIIGTLVTCIDPFYPKLDNFQSLFVVDALVTDENISNTVRLSRTKLKVDEESAMISGALVIIKDNLGNSTILTEKSEGVYKTDSLSFKGETGRSYTLYIKTAEGEEYESEECLMYPIQDIDSIYYSKDEVIVSNETQEGIRIYVDSKDNSGCNYYRWTFEEWWKFDVPFPKEYDYVNENTFIKCNPVKKSCWNHRKSNDIIIKSSEEGVSSPILFIAPDKSDRLSIRYCIQVRQLSLSKEEYEFWDQLKKIGESGGDIFDKQPFQISGNVHKINDSEEQVLGYFQVSGAKVKRRYIINNELSVYDFTFYQYACNKIGVKPDDFAPIPLTYDQIYQIYSTENSVFIGPLFEPGSMMQLIFVAPYCADCTLNGTMTKPDFWTE